MNKTKETPILTQMFRPTRKDYDGNKFLTLVRRFVALVLATLLLLVGPGLIFIRPWSILTCRHVGREQTDCRLEKRIAWAFPTEERAFADLRRAEVRSEYRTRIEDDGERTRYTADDVVLINDSGEMSLLAYDESWSEIARPVADRINDYLEIRPDERLTVFGRGLWLHTLSTVAGLIIFLLFAVVFVGYVVGSLLLVGAWVIEGVLSVVERAARRGGRAPQSGGKIERLRRAARSVAIPPQDDPG